MENVKKTYEKPQLIKENFSVEEWIASCSTINTNASLGDFCSYTPENLQIPLFADGWGSCVLPESQFGSLAFGFEQLCLHAGLNNVFSS